MQLLDYAASLKLDAIQISSVAEYESLEPAHLAKVRDHAARLGIAIDGGTGCICPTTKSWNPRQGDPAEYLRQGLRVAKAVGAASLRCFIGSPADRALVGEVPMEKHAESTLKVLRAVRSQAMDLGVKVAIENHGDLSARELRTLIETAGKEFTGACLDTGNPVSICEDPLLALEVLGPYTVTTHIRDSVIFEHARGAAVQWVALGEGSLDWKRILARYTELCPSAAMQLEVITGRAPQVHPYFEPGFWKNYPNLPAGDFARFVRLARNGHPFMGNMVIGDVRGAAPPPELAEPLKQQQRRDLERSIEYAKQQLGVGVQWRKG
ncbi:MAG: sugar phosphate isomerase/epimerase [Acidobacteria bacterium]|nr:sugar phosphate isomerase/epimerase [Acidobacteriota bacterium]